MAEGTEAEVTTKVSPASRISGAALAERYRLSSDLRAKLAAIDPLTDTLIAH